PSRYVPRDPIFARMREPEGDKSTPLEDQVEDEHRAEQPQADVRPSRDQYDANAERQNTGGHDPAPARSRPHLETCPGPYQPGGEQEGAHRDRQRERG